MRGDSAALCEVNLEIAAGEHVCILGPNGGGKSTLIKTITRECYPQPREGCAISILGRERWNVFELRSLLGIVSPDLLASCTTEARSEEHTSELQSHSDLVCRLLLEKKKYAFLLRP